MTNPEVEGAKIEKYVKWGFAFVAAGIAAPIVYGFAMDIIEAMWALAGLAASALVMWAVGPALATYAANKRMALLRAAAAEDPIATLDNDILQTTDQLHEQEEQVVAVDTQWENVKSILAKLRKTDPDEATAMQESEDLLKAASQELHAAYDDAAHALAEAVKARDKADRIWQASCAINKALMVAGSARSKAIQDFKKKVALDAVSTNMSTAMARLRMTVQKHQQSQSPEPKVVEGSVVEPQKALTTGAVTNMDQLRTPAATKVGVVKGPIVH
jgi:hypothetical protein